MNILEEKKQIGSERQNSVLISDLLELSPKKACKKSCEQNSQLKVHFLAFSHTLV